jgi:crotonobetainyl-CoA:carnitine CoA-transferase CaiB-like acyl-CoA transferase
VPRGNASEHAVPHGVYPCAGDDRWVAIAVVGDDAWEAFRAGVGWPADPSLGTLAGRLAARAALDARVAEWTRSRAPDEVAAALQAVGVSAMTVENADDLRADPHLAARGALVGVEHPEIGPEHHVANPIRPSRTPLAPMRPAPLLGQHTEEVLVDLLGLDRAAVAQLVEEGVCR